MKSIILFLAIILINACSSYDSNKMNSENIDDRNKRIEKLSAEIKSYSELVDAEFDLFNVNGFSSSRVSLPGASSWDYKFAIKVKKRI